MYSEPYFQFSYNLYDSSALYDSEHEIGFENYLFTHLQQRSPDQDPQFSYPLIDTHTLKSPVSSHSHEDQPQLLFSSAPIEESKFRAAFALPVYQPVNQSERLDEPTSSATHKKSEIESSSKVKKIPSSSPTSAALDKNKHKYKERKDVMLKGILRKCRKFYLDKFTVYKLGAPKPCGKEYSLEEIPWFCQNFFEDFHRVSNLDLYFTALIYNQEMISGMFDSQLYTEESSKMAIAKTVAGVIQEVLYKYSH